MDLGYRSGEFEQTAGTRIDFIVLKNGTQMRDKSDKSRHLWGLYYINKICPSYFLSLSSTTLFDSSDEDGPSSLELRGCCNKKCVDQHPMHV